MDRILVSAISVPPVLRGNIARIEPARTCIGVTGLDVDITVEIELVAKRPG